MDFIIVFKDQIWWQNVGNGCDFLGQILKSNGGPQWLSVGEPTGNQQYNGNWQYKMEENDNTHVKNSMWMYPWEAHVAESGFEGCKWLGCFNGRGVIQDIKQVNADVESSTTML